MSSRNKIHTVDCIIVNDKGITMVVTDHSGDSQSLTFRDGVTTESERAVIQRMLMEGKFPCAAPEEIEQMLVPPIEKLARMFPKIRSKERLGPRDLFISVDSEKGLWEVSDKFDNTFNITEMVQFLCSAATVRFSRTKGFVPTATKSALFSFVRELSRHFDKDENTLNRIIDAIVTKRPVMGTHHDNRFGFFVYKNITVRDGIKYPNWRISYGPNSDIFLPDENAFKINPLMVNTRQDCTQGLHSTMVKAFSRVNEVGQEENSLYHRQPDAFVPLSDAIATFGSTLKSSNVVFLD